MNRAPRWCVPCLAAGGLLTLLSATAAGHPGVSASLKIAISDEEVSYETLFSADYLRQLAEAEHLTIPSPTLQNGVWVLASDEERAAAKAAFEALLKDVARVRIDGIEVRGVFRTAEFSRPLIPGGYEKLLDTFPPDGKCVIAFPAKGKPKEVSLYWNLFPQDPMRTTFGMPPEVEVVAELDAYDENKLIVFSFDEPEHIWHAATAPPQQRIWPVLAESKPVKIGIPVLSVGLVGGWLVVLAITAAAPRMRRMIRAVAIAGVVPLMIGGFTYRHFFWELDSPWAKRVRPPTDEEARRLLESLQRNIYRAFEYKTESDVYDVLAQSVDGPLLDNVYNEVHQSLILRDQGGAVARVKEVDIESIDVLSTGVQPDGRVAVQLSSTWEVVGAVFHWGHVHTRINEYNALYTIAARDDQWRITGVEVMSQKRIVKEGDDPLPPLGGEVKPPPGPS